MDRTYKHLNPEQVSNFINHGFLRLESCFSRDQATARTSTMWARLGMSPDDKSTWTQERTNMPTHHTEDVKSFVPKAWAAICELLGGEDRVDAEASVWFDGFIVNLGTPEWEEHAGGTLICPDAIPAVAKHLYNHPEGVSPNMGPRDEPAVERGLSFYHSAVQQCSEFFEMTGNVGDFILMHPLMVHSASRNSLRIPRIITNPCVALKEPFNFDRERPEDYSMVELKTLQVLGKERLQGWKITSPREKIVPDAWRVKSEMKRLELERLGKDKGTMVS